MFKIAIIGPESTGKSSLAKDLAKHFGAPMVPEYAREYVEKLAKPYTFDDVCAIAQKQIEAEKYYEKHTTESNFVFFDTDLIITKIWFSFCYNTIPRIITEQLKTGYFDLYLLCAPDLPWVPDSVREHGHDRAYFFNLYRAEIEQLAKPFVVIEGIGLKRLQNAINACKLFLEIKTK